MFDDVTGLSDLVESGCFPDLSMDLVDAVLSEADPVHSRGAGALADTANRLWMPETVINRAKRIVP